MASLKEKVGMFKEWIRKPLKMLHLLWFISVGISFVVNIVLLTGVLEHTEITESQQDIWFEVNNQTLNLLFTILSLYLHPKWCHRFFLLCRWRPEDVSKLRKFYCKNGTEKPDERVHMMVVIILFQVNCFAQYVVCGLNWAYRVSERPMGAVKLGILIAIVSASSAGLYKIFGPLGKKDHDSGGDEEAHVAPRAN